MTIKKKLLSAVLSLSLAFQVSAITLPVYAEEGTETEPVSLEEKLQAIREETNLLTNGGFEEDFSVLTSPTADNFGFKYGNPANVRIDYEVSGKEYYSEGKSLFQSKTNDGDERIIAITDNIRNGATYIASAMALGTVANKPHWDKNTLKGDAVYQPKISLKIDPLKINDGTAAWLTKTEIEAETSLADITNVSAFPVGEFTTGSAYEDTEGARSPKTAWKRLSNIVEIKEDAELIKALGIAVNVGLCCGGITYNNTLTDEQKEKYKYLELYSDDYYLGELMVADVHINDIAEISLPEQGEEKVELKATAVNQLGTSEWLGECEYEWKIIGDDHGVSIEDNKLIVPADAEGGKIKLEVTCTPDFTGADTQSGEILKYRKKTTEVNLKKLTEEEREEAFLKGLNLIENGDLESELFSFTGASGGYGFVGNSSTITRSVSDKESYSGKKSLFQSKKDGDTGFIAAWQKGNVQKGRTYIACVMALGTVANIPHWNVNDNSPIEEKYKPKLFLDVAALKSGNTAYDKVSNEFSEREVLLYIGDFLTGAANDDPEGEKSAEEDWTRLINVVEVEETASTITALGLGVRMSLQNSIDGMKEEEKYLELYTDDYYLGELIVYTVENTTEEDSVVLPSGNNDKVELELKAEAYNQLGTQDGLENSTFKWEIVDEDKRGVSIEDNKLVVTDYAYARPLTLKGTCEPGFTGADDQPESYKLRREITVPITIKPYAGATEAPQAKNIRIEGDVSGENTLKLKYDFWQLDGKKEGASVIKWYRSTTPDLDGEWKLVQETTLQDPLKEFKDEYKLPVDGDAYFYRAEVIPVTESGIKGSLAPTVVYGKPVPPVASNVKVSGVQAFDEEWTASYDYSDVNFDAENKDKEKGTKYQWYVSPTDEIDENGKPKDGEPIKDAKGKTFKIPNVEEEYFGKYVYVGVTPVSDAEIEPTGKEAYSKPRLTSARPSITGLKIVKEGNSLTVDYDYVHTLGIDEGESIIEWFNGSTPLGTGPSLNVSSLKGETIRVEVTPVALKEPSNGEMVPATYKVPTSSSTSVGGVGGSGGGGSFKPSAPVKPAEVQNIPSWAKAEVDFVLTNKIMELSADNDFAGSNKINRGEFMMAMLKAAGIQPNDYRGSFNDVTSLDKFSGYLQAAFDQGVIASAENFYPARELTRDEMCKIIVTSIEAMTKKEISKAGITHFIDYSSIQSWALDFISEAVATGIIKGNADGSMNPKGNVTRAEAAVVANRIAEYVKAEGGLK